MIKLWIAAFRPKTLMASISPVVIGTVLALNRGSFSFWTFLLTLITALGIQIATNLANDYFDYIKGADTEMRKGPMRLTQSGVISLPIIRMGVWISLAFPAVTGTFLIAKGGVVIAALLALALLLAVAYTAGPLPLAYLGLGDVFVLVFFGPVAVWGTYFLQTGLSSFTPLLVGLGPGLISCAILVVNNIRDKAEDTLSNKKTLVVRFGKKYGEIQYISCLLLAIAFPLFAAKSAFSFLLLLLLLPAWALIRSLNKTPYNQLLAQTGQFLGLYTLIFSVAWML